MIFVECALATRKTERGQKLKSLVKVDPIGQGNRSNVETKEEGGIKDDSDFEHRRMIAP